MLKGANLRGSAQLRLLLEDIPRTRWRELLGVSDRTIRRWLSEEVEIPRAVFQALYWHTRWGDSEILSAYGFENQILRGLVGLQRDQLARLAVSPAANGPTWSVGLQLVRGEAPTLRA